MKKFDFSEEIKDLFGDPHFDTATMHALVEPQELRYYTNAGQIEKKQVRYVAPHEKPLTYRKAIFNALRQAGNAQNDRTVEEKFDKDEMGMLMLKLSADTDVELSVEERNNIIKACKQFSDTEIYIQVKQKLDPTEEEEEKEAEDKKPKKKKG